MSGDAITVGIPAYRPQYLDQAIGSVLAQEGADFTLLISDDSRDGSVRQVAARFNDARLSVIEGPRQGLVANSVHLWTQASGELLKFVYDDDFLLPGCLERMRREIEARPYAYAFCRRYRVDGAGTILAAPTRFDGDKPVRLDSREVAAKAARELSNPVGEPTSLLIRRSAFDGPRCLSHYGGVAVRHLIDICFLMNAAGRGDCVGVPAFLAAFREHAEQATSRETAPGFSAGVYEWELFLRGAADGGLVSAGEAIAALDRLKTGYDRLAGAFPELLAFIDGLPDLRARLAAGDGPLLDDMFKARIAEAEEIIAARARS